MEPEELIYTTVLFPQKNSETNVLLLVESIRSFAGVLAAKPIWVCIPETSQKLSTATMRIFSHSKSMNPSYPSFLQEQSRLSLLLNQWQRETLDY